MKSKNKDPAVLFYTSDFLVGCAGLTMEERGQYITLLCLQHTTGHLSKKAIQLAVGKVSADVIEKFQVDDAGLYYNDRMDAEITRRKEYSKSRSVNGAKGGRPKNHMVTICKPYANHTENENITLDIDITKNNLFSFSNTTTTTYNLGARARELIADAEEIMTSALDANGNHYFSFKDALDIVIKREVCAGFEIFNDSDTELSSVDLMNVVDMFIAYNKARMWSGTGGVSVLDDLPLYINAWLRKESIRNNRTNH